MRRGPRSLLAGDNRENSGFGEVASGARREADCIDFLSRQKMGVLRRPIAPRDDFRRNASSSSREPVWTGDKVDGRSGTWWTHFSSPGCGLLLLLGLWTLWATRSGVHKSHRFRDRPRQGRRSRCDGRRSRRRRSRPGWSGAGRPVRRAGPCRCASSGSWNLMKPSLPTLRTSSSGAYSTGGPTSGNGRGLGL